MNKNKWYVTIANFNGMSKTNSDDNFFENKESALWYFRLAKWQLENQLREKYGTSWQKEEDSDTWYATYGNHLSTSIHMRDYKIS